MVRNFLTSWFPQTGLYERNRLPPEKIGMVVDKGYDFPDEIREKLLDYGEAMWMFRDQPQTLTTRALNLYYGDHREYGLAESLLMRYVF